MPIALTVSVMLGYGILRSSDGSVYQGMYCSNKRHGHGSITYGYVAIVVIKGKGSWTCITPRCEKLASEALRHGSHSFLDCKVHHTCLYLVKHSPDGATTDSDNKRLIAAYYSFIDPERMKN